MRAIISARSSCRCERTDGSGCGPDRSDWSRLRCSRLGRVGKRATDWRWAGRFGWDSAVACGTDQAGAPGAWAQATAVVGWSDASVLLAQQTQRSRITPQPLPAVPAGRPAWSRNPRTKKPAPGPSAQNERARASPPAPAQPHCATKLIRTQPAPLLASQTGRQAPLAVTLCHQWPPCLAPGNLHSMPSLQGPEAIATSAPPHTGEISGLSGLWRRGSLLWIEEYVLTSAPGRAVAV